jgi:RHS repeat-associated protein
MIRDYRFTDLGYTGQRNYADFGLMDYNARFYSPTLGRFTQADTIIPDLTDTQSWNRFSYVNNSPIMYNDPSGHGPVVTDCNFNGSCTDTGTGGSGGGGYPAPQPDKVEEDIESETNNSNVVMQVVNSIVGNVKDIGEMLLSPGKINQIDLPFVFPIGFDNFPANGTLIQYPLITPRGVRSFGGALDSIPSPLNNIAGWGLAIIPAQIENISKGESFSNYVADLIIDIAGIGVGEVAGLGVGGIALAGTGNPLIGALGLVGGDLAAGIVWEEFVTNNNAREVGTIVVDVAIQQWSQSLIPNYPQITPAPTPHQNPFVTPAP